MVWKNINLDMTFSLSNLVDCLFSNIFDSRQYHVFSFGLMEKLQKKNSWQKIVILKQATCVNFHIYSEVKKHIHFSSSSSSSSHTNTQTKKNKNIRKVCMWKIFPIRVFFFTKLFCSWHEASAAKLERNFVNETKRFKNQIALDQLKNNS